jgi:cell division protein FtsQ
MNVFLQNQEVRHESQKRKRVLRVLKLVQQVSLIAFAWLVGIAGLYGAYVLVVDRNLFTVTRIAVEGDLRHVTADEIRALSEIQDGANLFHVAMSDVQQKVSTHPWVAEAAVRRKLPHGIWIYITEREPVALMVGKTPQYVDLHGATFPVGDASFEDLPLMTGFDEATPADVMQAIALITQYTHHAAAQEFGLSEIHFDPAQGFSVVGSSLPVMIRLGWKDFDIKLNQFVALWPAMRSRGTTPLYVDTNVSGKVIAKYDH